jgi:hypothetical protein
MKPFFIGLSNNHAESAPSTAADQPGVQKKRKLSWQGNEGKDHF